MKAKKEKHKRRYIPWFTANPDLEVEDNKENDSWMNYIHRNLHPHFGEESPFPGSEWSYTKRESVFDREETSDFVLHQDVVDALYECKDLDASEINVNVLNGVVVLSGYVKSEVEKETATAVIWDIANIWNIRNEIQVSDEEKSLPSHLPGQAL